MVVVFHSSFQTGLKTKVNKKTFFWEKKTKRNSFKVLLNNLQLSDLAPKLSTIFLLYPGQLTSPSVPEPGASRQG